MFSSSWSLKFVKGLKFVILHKSVHSDQVLNMK